MKLVDLKRTKDELKADAKDWNVASPAGQPQYPWGLQIRLEREELDKLGVTEPPRVNTRLTLTVVAEVTGVSETRMANGKEDCVVTLQIEQIGMGGDAAATSETTPASGGAKAPTLAAKY